MRIPSGNRMRAPIVAVMRDRSTGEQAMVRLDVTSGVTTVLAKGMYRTPFFAATRRAASVGRHLRRHRHA